jgi:LCP family protein required for cell wall assembly
MMLKMNKTSFSLLLGALLGVLVLAGVFAGYSLFNPGWLSALFSTAPVRAPARLPTLIGQPGVFATVTPGAPTATPEPLPTAANSVCGGPETMVIALLGVDDRTNDYSKPTRTDALSLVNVRFNDKAAAILSIPRDLYVPQPNLENVGITQDRINTAYLYGEIYGVDGGGPAQLKETLELNFGFRVHRYIMVNFGAFIKFVDALGSVEVDVPEAIYDPNFPAETGDGTIVFELPAGPQQLDGLTARRYARTRHQDDDYHRIQRQQLVMLAIRDKLLSPAVIPQIPALISALNGLVRTDLSAGELASLACIGPQIDRSAIGAYAITGDKVLPWTTPGGGSVSIPNREAVAPLVDGFLGR